MKDYYGDLTRVSAAVIQEIQDEIAHTEMIMMVLFFVMLVSILLTFTVAMMNLVSITFGRRLRQSDALLKFATNSARGSMCTGDFVVGYKVQSHANGDYKSVPQDDLDGSDTEGEEEVDVELGTKRGRGCGHLKKTKRKK